MARRVIKGSRAIDNTIVGPGFTMEPFFRFRGCDAIGGTWTPYIGATSLTAAATAPDYAQRAWPLGTLDTSVLFKGTTTSSFFAPNNTAYDLTTQDICVMAVVDMSGTAANYRYIFSKSSTSGSENGIFLRIDANNTITARHTAASGSVAQVTSATITNGPWIMIHWFVDTNENSSTTGGILYVNGTRSGSAANFSNAGTAISCSDTSVPFRIGAATGGANFPMDRGIADISLWAGFNSFPGGASNLTTWDLIAYDHYKKWIYGI